MRSSSRVGDVFAAVFQSIGSGLYQWAKPAIDKISEWFSIAWDWTDDATRNAGNFIIREIVGAADIIATTIMSIPDAFVVAGEAAAEGFVNAIIWGFREVQVSVNDLINDLNSMAGKVGMGDLFGTMDLMKYADVDLGGDAATKRLAAGWGDMDRRLAEVAGTDYMGDFFGDVERRALENYNAGLEQTDKSARAAAKGLTATKEAAAEVNWETEFYRGTFQSLFADLETGLKEGETFWQALGNAGANALDKIADRALNMAAGGIFDMLFGAVMGGFGGSIACGAAMPSGGFIPGMTGPRLFDTGGWTGYGDPGRIAGLVHEEEFVVRAGPAAQHRPMLEQINAGRGIAAMQAANAAINAPQSLTGGAGAVVQLTNHYNFNGSGFTETKARQLMDENNRELIASRSLRSAVHRFLQLARRR